MYPGAGRTCVSSRLLYTTLPSTLAALLVSQAWPCALLPTAGWAAVAEAPCLGWADRCCGGTSLVGGASTMASLVLLFWAACATQFFHLPPSPPPRPIPRNHHLKASSYKVEGAGSHCHLLIAYMSFFWILINNKFFNLSYFWNPTKLITCKNLDPCNIFFFVSLEFCVWLLIGEDQSCSESGWWEQELLMVQCGLKSFQCYPVVTCLLSLGDFFTWMCWPILCEHVEWGPLQIHRVLS